MSYQDDMHIDEDALEVELLEQPSLMLKYSLKLAEARETRDMAKEELDLVEAGIDRAVRTDPEKYGIAGKVTEGAIKAAVLMAEEYKNAQEKLREADYELNVMHGVVKAIDARKSSLENLVKLHGQQYFAGPVVPHDIVDLREAKKKQRDETHHRVGKSLKRQRTK